MIEGNNAADNFDDWGDLDDDELIKLVDNVSSGECQLDRCKVTSIHSTGTSTP